MYQLLALVTGFVLAVLIYLNGSLGGSVGIFVSALIFHLLGLVAFIIIAFVKRQKLIALHTLPPMFLLAGVLSVGSILVGNICMKPLGISLMVGISLCGQLFLSHLIDHFGLFGMPVKPFRKENLVGLSLMACGVWFML